MAALSGGTRGRGLPPRQGRPMTPRLLLLAAPPLLLTLLLLLLLQLPQPTAATATTASRRLKERILRSSRMAASEAEGAASLSLPLPLGHRINPSPGTDRCTTMIVGPKVMRVRGKGREATSLIGRWMDGWMVARVFVCRREGVHCVSCRVVPSLSPRPLSASEAGMGMG